MIFLHCFAVIANQQNNYLLMDKSVALENQYKYWLEYR